MLREVETQHHGDLPGEKRFELGNENLAERGKINSELKRLGLVVIEMDNVDLDSGRPVQRLFLLAEESKPIATRFARPDLNTEDTSSLQHSDKTRFQEILAGLSPFILTIPKDVQKEIESGFEQNVLKPGFRAHIQGVVPQEDYDSSLIPIRDILGAGKESLTHPRLQIDVYDDKGVFVESIVLQHITKDEEKRVGRLKAKFGTNTSLEYKEELGKKTRDLYNFFQNDGIADKPVEDQASKGHMATRRGLTMLDCLEICMDNDRPQDWLAKVDPYSRDLNLSARQRETLDLMKLRQSEKLQAGQNIELENIYPSEMDVINEALALAVQAFSMETSTDPSVLATHKATIESLTHYRDTIEKGQRRNYHNIIRYDQWEFNRLKNSNFQEKLTEILGSGQIKSREGTFVKGHYLANCDIGKDEVGKLPALFMEGNGSPTSETPVCILETEMVITPHFKHEGCSVAYENTSLTLLKRIIVADGDIESTKELLKNEGFADVEVVGYSNWQVEMACISAAQFNLKKW